MKDLPELKMPKNFLGKISSAFIDRYKIVYLIVLTLMVLGAYTYQNLPKETVPDVSMNMMYVYMAYPGASVTDVESMVSEPIEEKMEKLSEVKGVDSTIGSGYTQVIIEFEEATNMDDAEQEVRNELAQIRFPEGSMDPVVGIFETSEMPMFKVTLTGNYNLTELKKFAENVQNEMENVKGIREVELSGGYDREIKIIVDPVRLFEYGLNDAHIASSLQGSNLNLPAGEQELDGSVVNVRVDERFSDVESIRNLVISASTSRTIFMRDVAIVEDSHKTPDSYSRVYVKKDDTSNQNEKQNEVKLSTPAIYMTVFREDGHDVVKPAAELRAIVENSRGNIIPSDVTFIVTSDMSVDVEKDLSTVINNALGGLICVIIVLYIFIGLNESLIVATVIPLSLFITFIAMKITHISFNTISLAGFIIALGLLVDNAIVIMENIDRLRDEGADRTLASKAGSNQVAPAILAASLTTVGAFLPVAIMPGMIGKFLGIMPRTIIYIILASLFVSIVITPALSSKFLTPYKKKHSDHKVPPKVKHLISGVFIFGLSLLAFTNQWHITGATLVIAVAFTAVYFIKVSSESRSRNLGEKTFIEKYKDFIYQVISSRGQKIIIVGLAILIFIASVMTIPAGLLKVELFPYEEPTALNIIIKAPIGTPLNDTNAIVLNVESLLYNVHELESFTSTVGSNGTNEAKIVVELIDKEERILSGNEIENQIRTLIQAVPGAMFEIEPETSMSPMSSGAAVSIGLKGDRLEDLEEYAKQYYNALIKVDGIVEPRISTDGGKKEVVVDIDPNRAAYYGLSVSQIANDLRKHISGATVGTYVENSSEYDISIYYAQDEILSVKDFDKIFFTNAMGSSINFNEVANIKTQTGIGTIKKEDGQMVVYIEADLKDGYNGSQVNQAYMNAIKSIELPNSITQVVGGDMRDLNEQIDNLIFSFMVALLIVYIVLVLQFNSLIQPLIILASVPFAVIGVVFGLLVTGNNLGFYAMFGVVALVGIAVNDAIVLIDYTNYLRHSGMALQEAVAESVKTRFQPVLATSLTTIGGVLPLALYNATFSQLGFALIFGLVASTVLTLLIIPMLYYSIEKRTLKWFEPKKGDENA